MYKECVPPPKRGRQSSALRARAMAWLARSLANSLKLDDADDDDSDYGGGGNSGRAAGGGNSGRAAGGELADPADSPRGVKEDLSELTKTLSRQFWGVASFLAPPPSSDSPRAAGSSGASAGEDGAVEEGAVGGIRGDLAEIGGRFRSGISRLSNNKAVTEISKIASSFLGPDLESEGEGEGEAVGVTDEVLAFARNISMHPETWLDFPLFVDEEDAVGFDMSDAQHDHALAVERLAPRLAALRIELCPRHMSEGCFWKIYFVLLHSRLNKHDAELLSTPQIVEARTMLMKELHSRTKPKEVDKFDGVSLSNVRDPSEVPDNAYNTLPETKTSPTSLGEPIPFEKTRDVETEKYPVISSEMKCVDKSVIEEEPIIKTCKNGLSIRVEDQKADDEGDDWLEDNADVAGSTIPLGNEEDVSFSDLEEDDDGNGPSPSARTVTTDASDSSKSSGQWVQLSKSPRSMAKGAGSGPKENNDWLSVDIDTV